MTLFWSFLAARERLHISVGQRSCFNKAAGIGRLSRGSASEHSEQSIFVILMILAMLAHLKGVFGCGVLCYVLGWKREGGPAADVQM